MSLEKKHQNCENKNFLFIWFNLILITFFWLFLFLLGFLGSVERGRWDLQSRMNTMLWVLQFFRTSSGWHWTEPEHLSSVGWFCWSTKSVSATALWVGPFNYSLVCISLVLLKISAVSCWFWHVLDFSSCVLGLVKTAGSPGSVCYQFFTSCVLPSLRFCNCMLTWSSGFCWFWRRKHCV